MKSPSVNEAKRAGVGFILLGLIICAVAAVITLTTQIGPLAGIAAIGLGFVLIGLIVAELAS